MWISTVPGIVSAPYPRPATRWTPTGGSSLLSLGISTLSAAVRAARRTGRLTAAGLTLAIRLLLLLGGLGFLDLAAWSWHRPVGYAAIGLSLLVIEWAVKRDGTP